MIGGRTPVTTPPNVVMGYPMGSSSERLDRSSSKESHHSPATPTMPQQVRNITFFLFYYKDGSKFVHLYIYVHLVKIVKWLICIQKYCILLKVL